MLNKTIEVSALWSTCVLVRDWSLITGGGGGAENGREGQVKL